MKKSRTATKERPSKTAAECSNCGMEKESWNDPKGYKKGVEVYCCEGCASGEGCTC